MRQRFNNRFDENSNHSLDSDEYKYEMAYKKVKRIKGFYIHLTVYILVNIFIIYANTNFDGNENKEFWRWQTFTTAIFWGIGLLANALSVFGTDLFFGSKWEENKINSFIEKERKEKSLE